MPDNNNAVQTVPQDERPSKTTFVLPVDVYESLRTAAFERRISQAQIVVSALREYLDIPDPVAA